MSGATRILPTIRRARGFHLYDEHGRRYLDLYQNGGRAILSHRPPGLGARVKGTMAQGLWGDYPSLWMRRLEAALRALFPSYPQVRVYATAQRAVEAAGDAVSDPALGEQVDAGGAAWWRPFLRDGSGGAGAADPGTAGGAPAVDPGQPPAILLPVLPFPASFAPQPVCARVEAALPDSDAVSPILLAGLCHAAGLVGAGLPEAAGCPGGAGIADRGGPRRRRRAGPPRSDALVDPAELLDGLDQVLWRRRGRYLELRCEAEGFEDVVAAFLEAGVIINPRFPGPSILPPSCSRGEFEKFAKVSRMAGR